MPAPVIQPAFASGELAPSLYGRVDLAKFHVGAALLKNFFVDYRGGARTGRHLLHGPVPPGHQPPHPLRLLDAADVRMLVFSDHKMHVVMNGALVLEDPPVAVNGVRANPFKMNVLPDDPPAAGVERGRLDLPLANTRGVPPPAS
jgi:hypothetical protein